MGKIVKFCSSCDEGFAEKFGYCPNCGKTLEKYELSPVAPPVAAEDPILMAVPPTAVVEPSVEEPIPIETAELARETAVDQVEPEPLELEAPVEAEPVRAEPVRKEAVSAASAAGAFFQPKAVDIDSPVTTRQEHYVPDGGFHVTVIEEKNGGQRNLLLLGAFGMVMFVLMSSMVYNIFSKDLDVGSINDDIFNAVIVEDVPTVVEEEVKQQQKDKSAGGGGGGGREEQEEVTQGDLADQSKTPTRPPDAKVFRSDNFELKMPPPQTEGTKTFEKKFDRWGDPNGRFASFSNGTGSGGGQGSGVGTGQGSGRGTGAGSGTGSGYGAGLGNGNGNGTGDGESGRGGPPPPPPAKPVGVTAGLKIISKPRPGYTDAARQANIQGVVILRVTFNANGSIGSISPVKGLPSGLTEQAIAAARRISFEPAKVNGIGQSVTKQIEYTFSIY
jgi:periplasmic protein TonB